MCTFRVYFENKTLIPKFTFSYFFYSLTVSCVMNLETDDEVYIEGGDDIGGRITITASSSFHGFLISAD